jgi:transposase, IS5 family
MRRQNKTQSLFESQFPNHPISQKMAKISELIKSNDSIAISCLEDLAAGKISVGATGISATQLILAAVYKQINNLTYRELEHHLIDSLTARAFVGLEFEESYSKSTLQTTIKGISPETWQKIQFFTVQCAQESGFEDGNIIRIDSTAVDTNIAYPIDSSLLADSMRVASRCFKVFNLCGFPTKVKLTGKKARKLKLKILNAKNSEERSQIYEILVTGCYDVLKQSEEVISFFSTEENVCPELIKVLKIMNELLSNLKIIIEQTVTRVFNNEIFPSESKVFSVFETHTDIISKGQRETQFGHKVFLTTGQSNLVIDVEIPRGNPNDAEKYADMLDRMIQVLGKCPKEIAVDGGFSSTENLEYAKEIGVKNAYFAKMKNVEIEEMCRSKRSFKRLRNFRAGIESNISVLKRRFGMSKVYWRGWAGFQCSIWSSVVAYNFCLLVK